MTDKNNSKRIFDVVFSCLALVGLSFLILGLVGMVRVFLGKPVFFRQKRPGLNGKPFEILKFRTMKDLRDSSGRLLEDEKRLSGFGLFLRTTSLDELPELWNVLKGEMSFVGPRPLLMEYLPLYSQRQTRRHEVRPGITGWAQIQGRNLTNWERRFELDLWYVDNRSFLLDLKILVLTVVKVIKREGVQAKGHVTMPAFTGNDTNSSKFVGEAAGR